MAELMPSALDTTLVAGRLKDSSIERADDLEEFLSDHSRIVFSSSFRRLVKKTQVFPLESNTSVRNRLTHSLEVADVGRTIARSIGLELVAVNRLSAGQVPSVISIVENACLIHDLGNPPFGHFGEDAIKKWFRELATGDKMPSYIRAEDLKDICNFDGNPQGFRIATKLHCERDKFGLNLTCASLLSSIKYPHSRMPLDGPFKKKIGFFESERPEYLEICKLANHKSGSRYWLAYLMELADDCCYCISDIADSFEKEIVSVGEYRDAIRAICKEAGVAHSVLCPDTEKGKFDFRFTVAIPLMKKIIEEATKKFVSNIDDFAAGKGPELSEAISHGRYLKLLKTFARQNIYKSLSIERIELAGYRVVRSLLDHFGILLSLSRQQFQAFVANNECPKGCGLEYEWRLFNRLSKRMLKAYQYATESDSADERLEWLSRVRLIVDFISGMTDDSAKELHQILTGTDSVHGPSAW